MYDNRQYSVIITAPIVIKINKRVRTHRCSFCQLLLLLASKHTMAAFAPL